LEKISTLVIVNNIAYVWGLSSISAWYILVTSMGLMPMRKNNGGNVIVIMAEMPVNRGFIKKNGCFLTR
jgi:hypothetical protein